MESNRVAHAFLFCGPRGIGKTSCARILAKSLNCQNGPTLTPCGVCVACQEIANTNSFDCIEIDGASNRGIDEIRTLRENIKFAPSYGRYKIYIVDEVHMLTAEAFNALLKTLEEPPPHAIFIFATTDVNKVPATIISRCQRFDFKRIPVQMIVENLKTIAHKENFKINDEALFTIAKASLGGMRDALSLLDQLGALSDHHIQVADVYSMLGLVETELLFELTDALGDKNCSLALEVFDRIIEKGKDIKQLAKDLTEHFRNVMVIKVGGKALGKLVEYPVSVKDRILVQAEKFSLAEILRAIEFLIEAQEVSRVTESLRMPMEVAFAKITYRKPAPGVVPPAPAPAVQNNSNIAVSKLKENKGAALAAPIEKSASPKVSDESSLITLEKIQNIWNALTYDVSRKKMSLGTYLQEGSAYAFANNKLTIGFSQDHVFGKEILEEKENRQLIEEVFAGKLNALVSVEFLIVDKFVPKQDEPLVQKALDMFKGKVVNKWHND